MTKKAAAKKPSFKIPYFLPELANDGLTTLDIAKSLHMSHERIQAAFHEQNKSLWMRRGWDYAVAMTGLGFLSIEAATTFVGSLMANPLLVRTPEQDLKMGEYRILLRALKTTPHPKADEKGSSPRRMSKLSRGALDQVRRERGRKLVG